jgi:hypothetical protein
MCALVPLGTPVVGRHEGVHSFARRRQRQTGWQEAEFVSVNCVRVRECACVRARGRVCVCACVRACERARACVSEISIYTIVFSVMKYDSQSLRL